MARAGQFTAAHQTALAQDGCAVVAGFLGADEVRRLRGRIQELLAAFDVADHPLTTFATGERTARHIGDEYFFASADKASYFLEEDAVVDGALTVAPARAVNKIGHGLHIVDPLFAAVTHSDAVRGIASALGYADPRVLQSMVICKQPAIGGAVPLHQDSTFLHTRPLSACGFWIALEDCTLHNGCLEYVPGSHRTAPIARRFVRARSGAGTEMVDVGPVYQSALPVATDAREAGTPQQQEQQQESVPIEVAAGSLVLIHGQVLHKSARNQSQQSRWIYTFHIVDGACHYDADNWLQMPAGAELTRL
ncbi:hypothetical protein IWQ57_001281 [Coemansia nantahalensis]|uniref:Uncharacterized protein n=1 Tax=Coemansia nantahalensis TaxID=2789366 RepID=A0ACC1K4L4_9FUNG|nr:hypothetical protein IWQ57_001281 [Coemansia nantahalensis]